MKSFKLALIITTVAFANSAMMAKYAHNPFVDGDFVLPIRPINPIEDEKDTQDIVVIEANTDHLMGKDTTRTMKQEIAEPKAVSPKKLQDSKKEEQKLPAPVATSILPISDNSGVGGVGVRCITIEELNSLMEFISGTNFFELTEEDTTPCIADNPTVTLDIKIGSRANIVMNIGAACNYEKLSSAKSISERIDSLID